MGLMYPRISTMTLAMSTPANQGFNSAALSISDSMGGALALATTGIVFAALAATRLSFPGVFAFAAAIAIVAILIAPRVSPSGADAVVDAGHAVAADTAS